MSKSMIRIAGLVLFYTLFFAPLWSQDVPEKSNLAIFSLNYHGAPPGAGVQELLKSTTQTGQETLGLDLQGSGNPETDRIFQESIADIDTEISRVFANLGRYNVRTLSRRLTSEGLDLFIHAIGEYRSESVVFPQAPGLGGEVFTQEDINTLVNSFIVVVPYVAYYQLDQNQDSNWEAEIVTNFQIINGQNFNTLANFSIETSGYSDDPREAMQYAVEGMELQLDFEIRSIDEFRIRTAVLERIGRRLVLDFGSDMGTMVGDEFEIIRLQTMAGNLYPERIALVKVYEVNRDFSIAKIIYEKEPASAGDQVKKLGRVGIDLTAYGGFLLNIVPGQVFGGSVGVKIAPNRGVYSFKPVFGMEMFFFAADPQAKQRGAAVSINLGAQYDLFLGRLRIIPQAMLGFIGQIPVSSNEEFYLRGLKSSLLAGIGYLLPTAGDNIELYLEGGYELQWSLDEKLPSSVQGLSVTAGVRIR